MVFSSTIFLFLFLPAVLLLYWILPGIRSKNVCLFIASLLFYAFGEPFAVLLMLLSICMNYGFGLGVSRCQTGKQLLLACSVILNLGLLFVYKYTDFLLDLLNQIFGLSIPLPHIALPIGISFFTFQAMSYVIDVYRSPDLVQKNIGKLALYISFFPQLVAGPIVRYADIAQQIHQRQITIEKTALGLRRFICGLAKKLLIANTMGQTADMIFAADDSMLSMPTAWLGAITYALQIYFDFSSYSDMAIGLGNVFGFHFQENFNYPYCADRMQIFWRKWHISLSTWFKEYLYIPLGGNRKGTLRTVRNRLIVFFCTGLWHGANLTFVIWGLLHGIFLLLEQFRIIPVDKLPKAIRHLYTLLAITLTFVIFRADSLSQAGAFLSAMFTGISISSESWMLFAQQWSPLFIVTLFAAILFSMPIKQKLEYRLQGNTWTTISYVAAIALFLICVLTLSAATYNPFIYFRF